MSVRAAPIVKRGLSWPQARRRAVKLPVESEATLQRKVIELAGLLGWRSYHPWTSIHSPSGWPDLALLKGERLIFAELKSERGKVSAEQQLWLDQLAVVPGVRCFIWRPSQWSEIVDVLKDKP